MFTALLNELTFSSNITVYSLSIPEFDNFSSLQYLNSLSILSNSFHFGGYRSFSNLNYVLVANGFTLIVSYLGGAPPINNFLLGFTVDQIMLFVYTNLY